MCVAKCECESLEHGIPKRAFTNVLNFWSLQTKGFGFNIALKEKTMKFVQEKNPPA